MKKEDTTRLYSDEISLQAEEEFGDYIELNLRKIEEYRKSFNIPVIGIAGADGKTVTKTMLSSILSSIGKTLQTPLDCSTATGVTSTLLKLNKDYKYAILELGMSNPRQFELSVRVTRPTIGAITNIGEAHLAPLGDKYFIADAKVELIRRLPSDGFAILNMDDDLVSGMEKISPTSRVIKFGLNPGAHFYASNIKFLGPDGISFFVNDSYNFHIPVYSSSGIYNSLAAIAIARALKIDFDVIRNALEKKFKLLPHRGNLIQADDVNILDHTYGATINSVNKSCESLVQFKPFSRKLILVIGDLEKLGIKSEKVHLNLGFYISAMPIDTIITVGKDARLVARGIKKINHTQKELVNCFDVEELGALVAKYLEPHTTVLFIGNRNLEMYRAIDYLLKKVLKSAKKPAGVTVQAK